MVYYSLASCKRDTYPHALFFLKINLFICIENKHSFLKRWTIVCINGQLLLLTRELSVIPSPSNFENQVASNSQIPDYSSAISHCLKTVMPTHLASLGCLSRTSNSQPLSLGSSFPFLPWHYHGSHPWTSHLTCLTGLQLALALFLPVTVEVAPWCFWEQKFWSPNFPIQSKLLLPALFGLLCCKQ